MARYPPIPPPKNEQRSKVFSGIRHAPFVARDLSKAYATKVIAEKTQRYAR